MFSMLLVLLFVAFRATVVAQSPLSIVCVAGQCLQGYSSAAIGAKLEGPGEPSIWLLPGQYTSTTNPQLLHNLLMSRSSTLVPSAGFESTTLSVPLNLRLDPGLAIYTRSIYSGQASFAKLPDLPLGNTSTPLTAASIALSSTIWVAVSNNNNRIIIWESVPDTSQLPSPGALSLHDVQSSSCSPPCSGFSVCTPSGSCTCPTGFTGSSCESCQEGFFGPTCKPCPKDCSSCDQGISGSGQCLTPVIAIDKLPSKCNCLNGQCGANGQCQCNPGWTTANNGTACAKCAPGFFLSATGDCQVCQLGCVLCADGTGDCITCRTGFTQDANDRTKCLAVPTRTANTPCVSDAACETGVPCPSGSFDSGGRCTPCSPSCTTCNGPTSNDCTLCATGSYFFDGKCVQADSNGVCQATNGMVANNNKFTCDSCGSKCTSCRIPNFTTASTIEQAECTACLPGFFLSGGKCLGGCPAGTFVSPQDDISCIACSSACGSCAGSADFCLTCPLGQVALEGKCVSSCPSDSFSSSGSCRKCHPDCLTCSGTSFNQCSSCLPSRPVLTNGRCLSTCAMSQYFDSVASACQSCHSSCSSCAGPGPNNCLACSSSSQVLRAGSCVSANCQGSNFVVPGLGACLSEFVQVPSSSGTGTAIPLPTTTGLSDPTTVPAQLRLTWWQILLMALGCAFICVLLLVYWRRRVRQNREKKTKTFAREKNLDGLGWRSRLFRFGERLFGRRRHGPRSRLPTSYHRDSFSSPKIEPIEHDAILRNLAPKKPEMEAKPTMSKRDSMDDLLSAYEYSIHSRAPSVSFADKRRDENLTRLRGRLSRDSYSLYTAVTGKQRATADPRESLQRDPVVSNSIGSSAFLPAVARNREGEWNSTNPKYRLAPDPQTSSARNRFNLTDAQAYMMSVKPTPTGGEMGVSLQSQSTPSSFPIPTYAAAPSFARPMMGANSLVPQFNTGGSLVQQFNTGGSLVPLPLSLTGNRQAPYSLSPGQAQYQVAQPPFMVSTGANGVSQPMHMGASYSTALPHNPFRHGTL